MKLNFIFSNLNVIVLGIWILFLLIVAVRFFRPVWLNSRISFLSKIVQSLKDISYKKLIIAVISLNIIYSIFVTWGQYHIWATAADFTKMFVNLPLPKEVPMPIFLEWTRPLFAHSFGFFLYYILGRVWLNTLVLFLTSIALYFILKAWKSFRGNFLENGPELFFILMLIVGWPGVVIFIPIGFIVSLLFFSFYFFKGQNSVEIEPAFIVASFIVLVFGKIIFSLL